jgi:prolyl-tRNA synthetase
VSTPGKSSVEEVADFLKIQTRDLVKIIVFETNKGLIGALVRGDHALVEAKLQAVSGVDQLTMAAERTLRDQLNSPVGFTGPVGLKIPLYADFAVAGMKDFVTGSNEKDFHLKQVNLGDFSVEGFFDLRRAQAGDSCPKGGEYLEHRGIEVGQVFFLGTKYSQAMGARYKDEAGAERLMVMGCYGIGVGRTAAAAIEQHHDDHGIVWPYPIAPFQFHLLSLNLKDEAVRKASEKIYQELNARGLEVLWDDRDENPGVKFKDGDLLGIPFRLVVGPKGLQENKIEIKDRKSGELQKIDLEKLGDYLWDLHQAEMEM